MNADRLLAFYERIADVPDAIARLRRFILELAVRGKLVEQDSNDEPASELLKRIAAEKARLVKAGEIKKAVVDPIDLNDAPFPVPLDWTWSTVGELMHVEMGQSPPSEHYNQSGDGVPFYQGKTDFGPRHPSPRYWCTRPSKLALSGDILISVRAPVGPTNLTEKKCCIGRGLAALRPYAGVDTDFALMSLRAFEPSIAAMGFGSIFVAINKRQLALFQFPLPPLAEQHRIIAKVDELMALCDRLEVARAEREATRDRLATASLARLNAPDPDPDTFRNHAAFAFENLVPLTTRLDQIKALRQTILNLAVCGKLVEQDPKDEPTGEALERIRIEREGFVQRKIIRRERPLAKIGTDEPPFEIPLQWRWKRIGEVALFTQYGTSTKSIPSEQGVPVLTMGNIQDGVVVWGNDKKIPATSDEFPALFLKKFDLLYNRTNSAELVGKTGIYLGEDDCKTFASYLIRVQLSKTSSSPRYMNLVMNAPVFRETQIIPLIKKQTGQANVNGTALKNMLVPLPPLPEQHRIVAKVDELMALCDRLEINLGIADTGRQHLLESLLRDVLVPRNEPCKMRRQ